MKKFAIALITCLAFAQSTQAATSALTESILEYEQITNALGTNSSFDNVIPANEFIVDIKRITRETAVTGTVKYEIVTELVSENEANIGGYDEANNNHDVFDVISDASTMKNHHHHRTKVYIATLNVSPNAGIGPNIITVVSITPAK